MKYTEFSNCVTTDPVCRESDWSEFISALIGFHEPRDANEKTKKYSTPAISPAIYAAGTTRANDNVVGWAEWMGLDIDNDGPLYTSIDQAVAILDGVPCDYVVHTTMKATASHHRFRVLLPLNRELTREEIKPAWDATCRMFGSLGPDPCCKDLSRIYVAPTLWQARLDGNDKPFNDFRFRMEGDVLDIDHVVSAFPAPTPPAQPSPSVGATPPRKAQTGRSVKKAKALPIGQSIYSSPVVTACMIEDYVNAPKGSHHTELFRFMTRVAGRAKAKGYDITAVDLIALAREVDAASPLQTNPNRWSRIQEEAERALRFTRTQ